MESDESLLRALLGGELAAFDRLYARHAAPLCGYLRRALPSPDEAEDVLHETFLALLSDRERLRAIGNLRAFLYQVARNQCLRRLRAGGRSAAALETEQRSPPEPIAIPELIFERAQELSSLRSAVAALPPEQARLYRLRASGRSYEELAALLEIPLGTVKSRLHELVRRLREEVRP